MLQISYRSNEVEVTEHTRRFILQNREQKASLLKLYAYQHSNIHITLKR